MNMLEYMKIILKKVSFDPQLFEKELRKAIDGLLPSDLMELKNWCFQEFRESFGKILVICFGEFHPAGAR